MVQSICICGSGTMGRGIAQTAAQSGFKTILYDVNEAALQQAKEQIVQSLETLKSKGRITDEEKTSALNHINFNSNIHNCQADLIIEAIIEEYPAKVNLIKELAPLNSPETIFATNTSSLSVSAIAAQTSVPERVVGMHFFNPPVLMKLVEVVKGAKTDQSVIEKVIEVANRMGKTPVLCTDSPGFIVNHVARPYYLEALLLLENGYVDESTIDNLLESAGFKMGPFKLMDLIGNDINYAVSRSVYEALGSPDRLKPSSIQEAKVNAGELGRKTKKGYYIYE
jgi:3-hydroxybutyryl-CoA dehydrogenase